MSAKFELGQVVATPAALEALGRANQSPLEFLSRHVQGDYGDVSAGDAKLNEEAIKEGSRILSAYQTKAGDKIWVITEAQGDHGRRASTCLLLPEEY